MNFAQMLMQGVRQSPKQTIRRGPKPSVIPDEKPCSICGEVKPIKQFRSYMKSTRVYHRPECISCENAKARSEYMKLRGY